MDVFEDVEQTAIMIRDAIRDIPKRVHSNNVDVDQIHKETQDLLHLLELTSFNASEGYNISRQLKDIRQERRRIKNENEMIEPLANVLKKFKNNLQELDKVVGDIRNVKSRLNQRRYHPRIRTDLKDKFDSISS